MSSTAINQHNEVPEMLRLKQAADFLNVSLTTLWRLAEIDSTFPRKVKASSRVCFYRKTELLNWLKSKEI